MLGLEDELRRMQARLERLAREIRQAIDHVHRQYRRELVLWEPPTGIVRKGERWT